MTARIYRSQNYEKLDMAIARGLRSELFALSQGDLTYEGEGGEMISVPFEDYGFNLSELISYLWHLDGEGKLEVLDPESKRLFIIPRYN